VDPLTLLDDACRKRRAAAVFCGGSHFDYPGLRDLALAAGSHLESLGARPGDRVAALFPNCHLYLAAYFAALLRRFVLVPLNLRLSEREMRAILDHSGARVLIGDPGLCGPLLAGGAQAGQGWVAGPTGAAGPGAAEAAAPEAVHLYYTSGTTGRPKGVVLTLGNLAAHVDMTLRELRFGPSDSWLHAAPMFHLADAWAVWTATAAGAAHVLLPRFEAGAAFELIEAHGVTITNLVPTMLRGLLAEAESRGRPLRSLRLLLSGGAPIDPGLVARVTSLLGCDYAQTYGLTETSPFLTFSLPGDGQAAVPPPDAMRLRARTGRAARGVDLRVVQPHGASSFSDVPADDTTVGEVIARGATVTPGYWRDCEATREAFKGGWFHTGDLATLDRHGSIHLVDRLKDVIISGGETVYSTEVENVLYEHPDVREAAVFGVPDETWGESVRAAVVLVGGDAGRAGDLVDFCRGRLAHYKCPRAVDLLAALPRTGSGKIDKKALREPFWQGRPRRIN
jgi:acyl-CoA synthetase (AMP-forming)/AMP-acid ligase II